MVDAKPWHPCRPRGEAHLGAKMEIYAAMVDRLDKAVGRVIISLKESGEWDNTIVIFLSDNGAEGRDPVTPLPGADNSFEAMGSAKSYVNYGAGWAQAATAPSWRFKTFATKAAFATPAFIYGSAVRASARSMASITHVTDIVPTSSISQACMRKAASSAGRTVQPIDGISWAKPADQWKEHLSPDRLSDRSCSDRARCAAATGRSWICPTANGRLFNVDRRSSERRDLSANIPTATAALLKAWERYARSVGVVLPGPPRHPNPPKEVE
jgi:arylsulfatase